MKGANWGYKYIRAFKKVLDLYILKRTNKNITRIKIWKTLYGERGTVSWAKYMGFGPTVGLAKWTR